MGNYFSDKTEEGIRLLWMQFDYDKFAEGQQLFTEAAEEGEADAYSFLARTYFGVVGLEENRDKAFELLKKSVELGSSYGMLTMLQFKKMTKELLKTTDIARLKEAADEVLRKAGDGHAFSQLMVGMYYYWGGYWVANGLDINKEYPDEDAALDARLEGSVPWFEKALYNGLTAALDHLFDIYEAYPGNEEKVIKALRFAAGCGDYFWKVRLANWFFEKERYEEALEAFWELAEDGYARAWYDLGFQYERGIGVKTDFEKSISCYEHGAQGGDAASQIRLGKLLLWGRDVPKDEAQAFFWFCKAADRGDEIAKMWKGHCLLYGFGVNKNEHEGTDLLYGALNFNYPGVGESQAMAEESQFDWAEDMIQLFWDLGDAHENGLGVPVRQHLAGYYFNMVADAGWPAAVEKMNHYKYGGLIKRWKKIK